MRRLPVVVLLCMPAALAAAGEAASPPSIGSSSPIELAESIGRCKKLMPDKKLRLTLHGEVGPAEIVAALAPLSCKPIVMGGSIPRSGKVSIDAPDLLSPGEATRLLVTAIDTLGLSIEDTGAAIRIVDSARGREVATSLGERGRGREAFVLRLVRLAEVGADEVAVTVGKLRSKDGEVVAVAQSRTLLLVDRLAQVERMEALARALDRPAMPTRMFVVPTHRQRPSDLVEVVEKIGFGGAARGDKPDPARPTLLAVDAARVILLAGSEHAFRRVQGLLERIDPPLLPGEERSGRISVMYLKHVSAEELVATVKEVLGQAKAPAAKSGGTSAASLTAAVGALEGEVKVTADKTSNAIVVSASVVDLETVRELVARLDIPRRQVYVEAAILDLSADASRQLGMAFHMGNTNGTVSGVAGSQSSSLSTLSLAGLGTALASGGLSAALIGQSFSVAGQSIPSLGVVIHALETTKNANVLSRPHLLTMDHAKATLSVGQTIRLPVASLTAPTASGALGITKTYSPQKVALTLDLTPHLSDDEEIRLEIDSQVDDLGPAVDTESGPTQNQRSLKTTVVVRDGETVVLGGLQKESASDTVEKIPGLGDIPILGRLFQTKSKQRIKQDLLIILTPYIIRDESDLRRIYERKEAERRELAERATLFGDPIAFDPHVDYRRKRGLLEEINRAARIAESESRAVVEARAALERSVKPTSGEVVVPSASPTEVLPELPMP